MHALGSQTPSHGSLGLSTEELEAKIGLYFGGPRRAGITSLPDGRGCRSLSEARLSAQQEWRGGGGGAQAEKREKAVLLRSLKHSFSLSVLPAALGEGAGERPISLKNRLRFKEAT